MGLGSLTLTNKMRGMARQGFLVKSVSGGFEYAAAGDIPVGVIVVPATKGRDAKIQTTGEAMVFADKRVSAGVELRMAVAGEGGRLGSARAIGTETEYVSIGVALEGGKGLIPVALNIKPSGGSSGGGGTDDHFDLINIGVTTHVDIDSQLAVAAAHIADMANPHNVTATQVLPGQGGQAGEYLFTNGSFASWEPVSFDVTVDGFAPTPNTIFANGTFDFVGDTTYIQIQWNQTTQQLEFSYVGPTDFYDGWDTSADTGVTPTRVGSEHLVAFTGGTYLTTDYQFAPGVTPTHTLTIDIDQSAFNADYYTQTAADALFATQTWVNNNFDDYNNWGIVDGIFVRDVISGDDIQFAAGTDMQIQYDGYAAGVHTITFSYVGTAAYTNWQLETEGIARGAVGNSQVVDFKSGTYTTVGYNLNIADHEVTIDIDQVALDGRYYTQTAADALFATQSWVSSNFDDYTSWDFEYGPSLFKAIASGNSFGIVGGTDIGTSWNGTDNILTINYAGSAGYTGWNLKVDASAANLIQNAEEVVFTAGTGITLNYTVGAGTNEIEIVNDGLSPWVKSVANIYYPTGYIGIGTSVIPNQISLENSVSGTFSGKGIIGDEVGNSGVKFYDQNVGNMHIFNKQNTSSYGAIYLSTGSTPTPRMTVYYNGNVGIGTTTPTAAKLQIDAGGTTGVPMLGLDRISGQASIKAAGDTYLLMDSNGSVCGLNWYVADDVALAVGGGNVGIGDSTPSYKLDVNGTLRVTGVATFNSHISQGDNDYHYFGDGSDVRVYFDGADFRMISAQHGGRMIFSGENNAGTQNTLFVADPDNSVSLYYAGVQKFLTTSAGISVSGGVIATGEVAADTYFRSTDNAVVLGTNSAGIVYLRPTNSGSSVDQSTFTTTLATIGTDMIVSGYVRATGEVESYDTSDINLKENIKRLDYKAIAREMLDSSLISYDHKLKNKREIGWIAQEIEMFLPENTKRDGDDNLMIHYGKMGVALSAVDRYQQDQIEELQAEVKELKWKLSKY